MVAGLLGPDGDGDCALKDAGGAPSCGGGGPVLAQLKCRVDFGLGVPPRAEAILLPLKVTLEELYAGASKQCAVPVRVPAAPGGDATTLVQRVFAVRVRPGAAPGTEYAFRRQGHQDPGRPAGDVVVVLEEEPHARFGREGTDGADLVQRRAVTLREALTGCTVQVHTLDGRLLRVAITDIVSPGYERRLPGEGLPRDEGPRGDLILRFAVNFPASLSRPCRALLDQALQLEEHGDGGGGLASAPSTLAPLTLAGAPHRLPRPTRAAGQGGVARAILEAKMRRQADK